MAAAWRLNYRLTEHRLKRHDEEVAVKLFRKPLVATAESTGSLGERVSRIEGGYEHLATKADLAQLKAELKADLARLGGGTTGGYRSIAGPQSNGADLSGEFAALRREIRSLRWWILSWGAACVVLPRLAVLLFGS